jgi:Reversibly glycosylated polypeptide
LIFKKICDAFNYGVAIGMPYLIRAKSNEPKPKNHFSKLTNINLMKLHEVHEEFSNYINFAPINPNHGIEAAMRDMGEHIKAYNDFKEFEALFKEFGQSIQHWANRFTNKPATAATEGKENVKEN